MVTNTRVKSRTTTKLIGQQPPVLGSKDRRSRSFNSLPKATVASTGVGKCISNRCCRPASSSSSPIDLMRGGPRKLHKRRRRSIKLSNQGRMINPSMVIKPTHTKGRDQLSRDEKEVTASLATARRPRADSGSRGVKILNLDKSKRNQTTNGLKRVQVMIPIARHEPGPTGALNAIHHLM